MPVQIDKTSKVPLYLQLKEILIGEIKKMNVDDMIEPESALITKYDVSRTTVRQAISELIQMNYLYTVRGKGTFVANRKSGFQYMNKIESYEEQVTKSGMIPETKVLQNTIVLANDEVADGLGIQPGQGVLYLKRLRFANHVPLAVVESWLPLPQCAALANYDLGGSSLFGFLDQHLGMKVAHVHRVVSAILADSEDQQMLKVPENTPLLHFTNQSYTESGEIVEFCHSRFRVDMISFTADM